MIGNGGIDLIAGGRDEGHQSTEAVPLQRDLSSRFWQLNRGALHDVFGARIAIIRRVQSQTVLPVSFRPYVKIDARLLPPE
jgi:hypothetical protein